MQDKEFWSRLEFVFSGWLEESEDKELRRYWCDGISPSKATNTKLGLDIEGDAWIGTRDSMDLFQFNAAIPQDLLKPGEKSYKFKDVEIDPDQRLLSFRLERA